MSTPLEERVYWDEQARQNPSFAAWAEPDYAEGVEACLEIIEPWMNLSNREWPKLLDLGCGPGRLAIPYAQQHPDTLIVGVDISYRMLEAAREAAVDLSNLRWCLGNGRKLPAEAHWLSGGWSILLFQHLDDETVAGYLAEVADALLSESLFVFQYVLGEGGSGFSYGRTAATMSAMCVSAGLEVRQQVDGLVRGNWSWIIAAKP